MRKLNKEKLSVFLCAFLWLFYLAHYFVPFLNSTDPWILGIPFTVLTCALGVLAAMALNWWCAERVWDSFDEEKKEEKK